MPLRLYLDDCSNSDLLALLLSRAGHHVVRPTDVGIGLQGADDEVHFSFAAKNGLAIVTKNPADFEELHRADPNHAGVFAIYQDNGPSRDMSDAEIVNAIANIENATHTGGDPVAGHFHRLNDWRF